jgi:hypothetical protein
LLTNLVEDAFDTLALEAPPWRTIIGNEDVVGLLQRALAQPDRRIALLKQAQGIIGVAMDAAIENGDTVAAERLRAALNAITAALRDAGRPDLIQIAVRETRRAITGSYWP